MPFLNQRKGENDRRKYFTINLHERMLPTSAGVEPATWSAVGRHIQLSHQGLLNHHLLSYQKYKNSAEGVIAPAGAKVTGATIRMWLLNKFISFLAVLTWKTGLKKNVDKVPSGAHIFQASPIPSNGFIFSTDFSYVTGA